MINPFYGELFMYPIALELSHNFCSNKCAYCFANLNSPNRKAEVSKVANQLSKYNNKKDFTSLLMQNSMAICMSNKTDPFATSNYQISIPQILTLNELEIPIAYHSRLGKHFDNFYKTNDIPKTLFYISICHTDDAVRKKIEPNATPIEYRWQMAKQLIKDGHQVVVGLNPYVSEWIDHDIFIKNCLAAKVKNVVVQPLHLNSEQIKNISAKELNNIGEVVLGNAKKRESPYYYSVKNIVDTLIANGINAYDTQNFNKSNIMETWHKGLKNKTFLTYYDFYHWCLKNKKDNDAIFFDEFYNFIKPQIFEENTEYQLYNYITSVDRSYRKTNQSGKSIARLMTFKDLCKKIWNDENAKSSLSRSEYFSIVGEITDKKELVIETDDEDNFIYAFNQNKFDNILVHPLNINVYD